ncbi:MAG: UDP-N-acetylmuramate dehydrogenase [Amoebophilaceae bacterium]|jgi:UDP-N-acetylmuramate dehydrogenase|nr:UDP-N-acetylmuramate dehydrogenase [Amoebophilaceae bacterium]
MSIQENVSLKHLNTLGIDAQARYYAHIDHAQHLRDLLQHKKLQSLPRLILGGGSNVLFLNDFKGTVMHMTVGGIATIREDPAHVWVKAGAGVNWHTLVRYCVEKGYSGIENLSLIPGTVGAAPIQNIGAYGVTLSDTFESLEAMEVDSGSVRTFTTQDCAFGYRDSVFKNACKEPYVILNVTLKLQKQPTFRTTYGELQETLEAMGIQKLSIKAISDAVIHIRQNKLPDPAILGNAGSFFKNPVILQEQFKKLRDTYPNIPGYIQSENQVKIPSAWLIEQCGWKGKRRGDVGVHTQHALILVNYANGTGQEIYQLAQDIQQSVKDTFNIEIVPEVQLVS